MNRITGFLSLDFSDPISHRFDRCLGIHIGDIVSPRCLLTESDISACPILSNAIGKRLPSVCSLLNLSRTLLRKCQNTMVY